MSWRRMRSGLLVAPPYTANAVRFDGSNDHLTRGANLTGVSDGKEGIFSCWVRFRGGNDDLQIVFSNSLNVPFFFCGRTASGFVRPRVIRVAYTTEAPLEHLELQSLQQITSADGWVHILASWNLGDEEGWLYINDASDLDTDVDPLDNVTIDYTRGEFAIGADTDGSAKCNADIADFFLDLSTHLDLSVTANRRKFISSAGKPVNLASNGSRPLGSSPHVFLSGPTASWHTNKGTGGGFVENGALTDAATSPSD